MFFRIPCPRYTRKHPEYSDMPLLLKIVFSIFYRNAKISTSCTAKSGRVGEQPLTNSDSAAKKKTT